jgi:D-glycero-D-manno-heptose 1,7-bisphosphate phosphatase
MFTQAADEQGVDLTSSYMIGDSVADVLAANAVGVQSILVKTGNGKRTEKEILNGKLSADFVGDNLSECAEYIVNFEAKR